MRISLTLLAISTLLTCEVRAQLRAGAFAEDISPTTFPTPVNGNMKGGFATSIHDPMHARCLALHDGKKEVFFCVVDACMIPREICEKAKEIASQKTGVPKSSMLISATHTHSAATMTPVFQSDPDPDYIATLPERIADGFVQAHENLEPAEMGWAFSSDPDDVFNRRWYMKTGETYENPFGSKNDRALMNPGLVSPKVSVPSGPVDQDVAVLAVRSRKDKRPLALLANYSLHYVGGYPSISADYYGAFAEQITQRLKATDARYVGKPSFVGILSNGTSGNINNINFGSTLRHKQNPGEQLELVAGRVADAAQTAYDTIHWDALTTVDSVEEDIQLHVRKANDMELYNAKRLLDSTPKDKDGQWSDRKAIYAREALKLAEYPDDVPVKLQVFRIGDLSIAAIPCEVFVEIGRDLKMMSPFSRHFTISLANGYNGYLPTPEHHSLGGYETWRARSSYLEVSASVKITDYLKSMLSHLKEKTQ